MTKTEKAASSTDASSDPKYLAMLSLGALGVVFGDIGTSPLYAFRETFASTPELGVTQATAYGLASAMFWAMMLIVTFKYLVFVMRADNDGEGGILALTSMIAPDSSRQSGARRVLVGIGLFGTALLYGDGIITPAISVLSAVEGLEVVAPQFHQFVVPIAAMILIGLFTAQSRGTARLGSVFGPVMILWFSVLAVMGIGQIISQPGVIAALSPTYAFDLFAANPGEAFRALGAVFLVVTGSEALYADMGHFGRRPIRLVWFSFVFPALTLNYLGQAALVSTTPASVDNPFYRMAPEWTLIPLLVLATMATIIASQALITGAFSLTMQAVHLGYLPRVRIEHTSRREMGQIYVPAVNWTLMIACVVLVVTFQSASSLAAAYGVAVTSTMLITTALLYVVMRERWGWSLPVAGGLTALFVVVDLAFFGANALKIPAGGWFPIAVGLAVFAMLTTWKAGRRILDARLEGTSLPIERFIGSIEKNPQQRVQGTAVFLSRKAGTTPPALLANLRSNEVLHSTVVLVTVQIAAMPIVPRARRATVHNLGCGFTEVFLQYGFMERIDVPNALSNIVDDEFGFDQSDATFFLGKETVVVNEREPLARWRAMLFQYMHRNAGSAARYFGLPLGQVMEIGSQIEM